MGPSPEKEKAQGERWKSGEVTCEKSRRKNLHTTSEQKKFGGSQGKSSGMFFRTITQENFFQYNTGGGGKKKDWSAEKKKGAMEATILDGVYQAEGIQGRRSLKISRSSLQGEVDRKKGLDNLGKEEKGST